MGRAPRSEHGNGLHFISSAVHFLYNNFPKKSIFSTTTSQKKVDFLYTNIPQKAIFQEKNQKNCSPKPRDAPPRGGSGPRADPPTLADPAIPKPGQDPTGPSPDIRARWVSQKRHFCTFFHGAGSGFSRTSDPFGPRLSLDAACPDMWPIGS